jgi:hypothetical protein
MQAKSRHDIGKTLNEDSRAKFMVHQDRWLSVLSTPIPEKPWRGCGAKEQVPTGTKKREKPALQVIGTTPNKKCATFTSKAGQNRPRQQSWNETEHATSQ